MFFGTSVGEMIQKKWMSFGEILATQLAAMKSFWPLQVSCTSWTSVPRKLVEVAIRWKMEERLYDPYCSKLAQWNFWLAHLATFMTSDSLEKASHQGTFRAFPTSLPSFCLLKGHSLGMSSMLAASSAVQPQGRHALV